MVHQIETRPETIPHRIEDESFCQEEVDEPNLANAKTASAEDLAAKRRNADEFVHWLNQRDSMLKRRQRDLCEEIESILPFRRARSASDLDTAVGISEGDAPRSIGECPLISDNDDGPKTVIVEKLDDHLVPDSECLLSSVQDTCPSIVTAIDAESLVEDDVVKHPETDLVKHTEPAVVEILKKSDDKPPIGNDGSSPSKMEFGKKQMSTMITKMHELLAEKQRHGPHNLHTLWVGRKNLMVTSQSDLH